MSKLISFSQTEKDKISKAVQEAEKNTSGEIVPYFVDKSDNYNEAPIYSALAAGVFLVIILNILSQLWLLPFKFDTLNYSVMLIGIMTIVFLAVMFIPPLKRVVVSDGRKAAMVNKRAMQAFVEEEVFNTRDRTGILIFISSFEHRVEIIADSGINEKTDNEYWIGIVSNVIKGIKEKKLTDSLVKAISECGKQLQKAGFTIKEDDTNEIGNEIRIDKHEE